MIRSTFIPLLVKKWRLLTFFFVVTMFSFGNLLQSDTVERSQIEHSFISNPNETHCQIEFFVLKPEGTGPFPILFLLHGHQPLENSPGGEQLVKFGYLETFVKEGIIAVAISVPGFGLSEGPRDFSGPNSQKAVAAVVEYFTHFPFVDSKRMGIYGISKGATLASMVHKYTSVLSLQILEAGWYDLTTCSSLMPNYLEKIRESITAETGGKKSDLIERSAVHNTELVDAKTLILVGEFDDRRTLPSAIALHEKLLTEGKDSRIKIYSNTLHTLPPDKWSTIISFTREHFFNTYGIGVGVSLIMPAIQIAKIHPNTPAALSGKLHVGDVILRISPNNDEKEVDVLRMPVSQLISLILGKKGTAMRLHIQHFDQTCEDIVIERGET